MGAIHNGYSYYGNSKYLQIQFREGVEGNSITSYVTRADWSDYDRFIADLHSIPMDRHGLFEPKIQYLVYEPENLKLEYQNVPRAIELNQILSDPNNSRIPENFEVMYHSKESGKILYKINLDNEDQRFN